MIPVRFSVFQPFEAELGTNRQSDTVNSTNSKKDINKSEETEKSKSRGESSEISSGKKTDGILFADRESTGKFINKTISDGGITVDFPIIKVQILIDHRIAGDLV